MPLVAWSQLAEVIVQSGPAAASVQSEFVPVPAESVNLAPLTELLPSSSVAIRSLTRSKSPRSMLVAVAE